MFLISILIIVLIILFFILTNFLKLKKVEDNLTLIIALQKERLDAISKSRSEERRVVKEWRL